MSEHKPLELFASCLAGLEGVLADEFKQLGIRRVRPLSGGIAAYCDVHHALKACLWSRLASRVLLVVGRVDAHNAHELYQGVYALCWEQTIAKGVRFAVQAHGSNNELRNTHFTALKVKDAICDCLRDRCGVRPEVDTERPDALIDVRLHNNRATISLDLAGSSLYQRTYLAPEDGTEAPLQCALSAGLLALAGWSEAASDGAVLLDPSCGNGSVVVEAAAVACNLAPGLTRDRWGFFGWSCFDEKEWLCLLDDADACFERGIVELAGEGVMDTASSVRPDFSRVRFAGLTTSSPAIARARERAKRAGLRQILSFERGGTEEACAVIGRQVTSVQGQVTNENVPCLVTSVLTAREHDREANVQADATRFASVAKAAPVGSVFAVAGGQAVEDRFGVEPCKRVNLGRDRVATEVLVFDASPTETISITVPDSAGGAEHTVEALEQTSEQFVSRLIKVARERRKWARREGVTCYRLYDADLPDYAVAIDLYTGAGNGAGNTYLHIAEYAPPASIDPSKARRRFNDVLALAPVTLGIRADHVFVKKRRRDKGGRQYHDTDRRSYITHVQESGYLFEVDLSSYLDTGLFLDHRLTRELIGQQSKGTRFLNLFAYTATATVYAAGGGARETTTVDLSQTYLDWAQRNMAVNGFRGSNHTFERADVIPWLRACRRSSRRFDFIFVDPPTFSNSKSMGKHTWDVQRDHVELLIGVVHILADGGQALFSCNLRSFKPDFEALNKYGVAIEDISAQTIPHDFSRNPRIHTCYRVWKASPSPA